MTTNLFTKAFTHSLLTWFLRGRCRSARHERREDGRRRARKTSRLPRRPKSGVAWRWASPTEQRMNVGVVDAGDVVLEEVLCLPCLCRAYYHDVCVSGFYYYYYYYCWYFIGSEIWEQDERFDGNNPSIHPSVEYHTERPMFFVIWKEWCTPVSSSNPFQRIKVSRIP